MVRLNFVHVATIGILQPMKRTFFIFCFLLVSGFAPAALAASSSTVATTTPAQATEAAMQEYFADTPVMIEIARCESKLRQYTDSGNVLRGGAGDQMVGVFQFFDRYHEDAAAELGHDISTREGNLAYARHVYTDQGTDPWNSSRDCWETSNAAATTDVVESDEVLRQKIALLEQIITLLQTLLTLRQSEL
jgi:hypothetical protein